jgi:hypothetical protein
MVGVVRSSAANRGSRPDIFHFASAISTRRFRPARLQLQYPQAVE